METKFTKSPWHIWGDWAIRDSNDRLIAQFEPLCDEISNGNTNESLANANLIAAAPDMYEMLNKMRAVMYHLSNEPSLPDSKRVACLGDEKMIIELLSRARGEGE